jgi:hypothetical protein
MKQIAMKKIISTAAAVLLLAAGIFTAYSFTLKKIADDIWKQLGMTEQQAKDDIRYSFFSGYLNYYGARDIKNIALGDRTSIATNILAYTKKYTSSPDFEKEYQRNRELEKAKIVVPVPMITREELTTKKITEAENSIKTFEDLLKNATDPGVIKSYKEQLAFWKKAVEDYKSPLSSQINYELQMDANRYKTEKDSYDQLMKIWEKKYPGSSSQFVKQRLTDFLESTGNIDYKAEVIDKNKKKIFVNPVYEKKNWKWKMGFRAGKEATETARAFAQQWLKEL